MKVLKFGGSSVGTAERIVNVMHIIEQILKKTDPVCVVFSAYQGVTDQLIEMGLLAAAGKEKYKVLFESCHKRHRETARALIAAQNRKKVQAQITRLHTNLEEILYGVYLVKELTPKTLDYIMSFGERLSAFTISESLNDRGFKNTFVDTRELIVTDNAFGNARVDFKRTNRKIRSFIGDKKHLFIITGFIGTTTDHETTTLGRGGSDFTASIFGAALGVEEVEIWTDVDGVMTADPRKVPQAFSIKRMTYDEAMELSHFGAKVIHPPTMQPALEKNITLRIKNTFNPAFEGTRISKKSARNGAIIRGLSSIDNVSLLQIQGSGMVGATGIAERIFRALAAVQVNIILISQASSEHSICLGVLPECSKKAKKALEQELRYELHYGQINEISIETDMSIIAVVGENMRRTKGIAGKIFQTLGKNGVNISAIAQGSSELNISMVIDRGDEKKALNAIHNNFFMTEKKVLNLYLVGTGLIGSELLRQLSKQADYIANQLFTDIRVIGIADIDRMLIAEEGIPLKSWYGLLKKSGIKSDLNIFVKTIKELSLSDSVFIDCTASEAVTDLYGNLLGSGISIVTPNKMANAQPMKKYNRLRSLAQKTNGRFLYETNVGAGLPVIATIRDLRACGDRITKIEGVLSGTLSYLFNSFDGRKPFSRVVFEAKTKGYTEPDPRQDLNGIDVARKLIILVREAGYKIEMKNLILEELLPPDVDEAKSVAEMFRNLKKHDSEFESRRQKAAEKGKVLRYIACFENGKAQIRLTEINSAHPFFNLKGSENIIALSSDYYNQFPLVIKGPGAGATVTAAGVFADILRLVK
jgi:aspartokinase/homoserine dehydrogenase 1